MKKSVEDDAGGFEFGGIAIGCLDLPQNLGLSHHHGIETGGDPEYVANGRFGVVAVEVWFQCFKGEMMEFCHEALDPGNAAGNITGGGVNFYPVTGGNNDPLNDTLKFDQFTEWFFDLIWRECCLFTYLNGCSFVRKADDNNIPG